MNTLKIGTFVNYDAENDGKELMNPMVYAEVIKKNSDGTVNLQPHDCDDFDEIENANPECCTPLDHFAGMIDNRHYYMDGKYNVYGGYYEHYITTKELGNPYSFEGTLDSLEEAIDLMCYYDDTILLDKDLEEEWGDALGKPDVVDLSDKTEACKSSMQRKQESFKHTEGASSHFAVLACKDSLKSEASNNPNKIGVFKKSDVLKEIKERGWKLHRDYDWDTLVSFLADFDDPYYLQDALDKFEDTPLCN